MSWKHLLFTSGFDTSHCYSTLVLILAVVFEEVAVLLSFSSEEAPPQFQSPPQSGLLIDCDFKGLTLCNKEAEPQEFSLLSQSVIVDVPSEVLPAVPWFPHWQIWGRAAKLTHSVGVGLSRVHSQLYSLHIRLLSISWELHICGTWTQNRCLLVFCPQSGLDC